MDVHVGKAVESLYVDRYRIQTALLNIIQNSLEAMPGGGQITITAATDHKSNFMAITIRDTGIGIPLDMLEKACEPFFSSHKNEGLRGLGLAIVRDIMKTHGGRLEIKSVPQEGTSVVLHLPLAQGREEKP